MKIAIVPKKIAVVSYPGLVIRSFLAGLISGAAVSVFIHAAEKLAETGLQIYSAVREEPIWLLLALPMAAALGLLSYLLLRLDPDVAGSGIPNAEGAIRGMRRLNRLRVAAGTVLGGLITLFGGLSLGLEGPSVAIGAAIGYAVTDWTGSNDRYDPFVAIGGAGAGFAAAFHAPIAGALFALEEFKSGFGASLTAAVTTSVLGGTLSYTLLSLALGGGGRLMPVEVVVLPFKLSWTLAIVAAVAGAFAALFIKLLQVIHVSTFLKRVPVVVRLIAAFVATALAAVFLPETFGVGTNIVLAESQALFSPEKMILLLAVEVLLTAVGFYSKATGGMLIPALALGALIGGLGRTVFAGVGVTEEYTAIFVVAVMAAFLGAAFGTPLSSAVLALELTGASTESMIYIAVSVFIAFIVAEVLKRKPLYEFIIEAELPAKRGSQPKL